MSIDMKTIGIVGAGQMGTGIAQLFATKGFKVLIFDIDRNICERARMNVSKALQKLLEKKRLNEQQVEMALSSISIVDNIDAMAHSDLVIEAVSESQILKKEIFQKLDKVVRSDVIIASNTSSISITSLASSTGRPDKVIGMHFMNPAPIMSGVEIIKGLLTGENTVNVISGLVARLDKTAIISNDRPGFIVNRILFPMLNEAMFALYEGVSTREEIDNGMKICCNHPIGPLALADMIGLDTVLAILDTLYSGFRDTKYRPCPLLKEYVDAGWLGKKSGRGFFEY